MKRNSGECAKEWILHISRVTGRDGEERNVTGGYVDTTILAAGKRMRKSPRLEGREGDSPRHRREK